MGTLRLSTQSKVRRCYQCKEDTEFYCITCKHDLCLQCKERHVIDLDTLCHDVVIYREKYEHIQTKEACVRHPDRSYEQYCHSCKLPVCLQCTEHRKHQIPNIKTIYMEKRQENREIILNIRSEILYNRSAILEGIKTDIKICRTEMSNHELHVTTKAQRVMNLIDTVTCDLLYQVTNRLPQQKRKIIRHPASIENYEHRYEQSTTRPVKFLLFIKKTCVSKIKNTPNLTQHALLSLTEEISGIEDLIKLLIEIQVIETGKRQVRNECILKLMSTPVLHKPVIATGIHSINHVSFVTPDRIWISLLWWDNLSLINTAGEILYDQTDSHAGEGIHTVNSKGDLIYINNDYNINKQSRDNRTKSTLIKTTGPWKPQCVYCSPSSGDLLVGMWNYESFTSYIHDGEGKVNRYNNTGQHTQTIQHHNTGQKLYSKPGYITENRNGDVIVSDYNCVVVTERGGRHRFSYTGPPSGSELRPSGICTDALSHILVCDFHTVHMLDKDGNFLSLLLTEQHEVYRPRGLSYNFKNHLLCVGSLLNRVYIYRYIKRLDSLTLTG